MRLPARFAMAILLAAVPLAACKKSGTTDSGNASGQILPGSASDAMLPEDRVTSQPPLDPGAVRSAKSGATGAPDEGEAAGAAPAASAAPEPAATGPAD